MGDGDAVAVGLDLGRCFGDFCGNWDFIFSTRYFGICAAAYVIDLLETPTGWKHQFHIPLNGGDPLKLDAEIQQHFRNPHLSISKFNKIWRIVATSSKTNSFGSKRSLIVFFFLKNAAISKRDKEASLGHIFQ